MKHVSAFWKNMAGAGLALAVAAMVSGASDEARTAKPKPYPLKTCIVSGEKLDGAMGKPHVFVYEGQEIKLCCQGCLKDFKKDPAKYLKKIAEAQKTGTAAKPAASSEEHAGHQH